MLSSVKEEDFKPHNVQEEIYLNFNHRPQRIIIYNLLVFLWSISNLLFYGDVVSKNASQHSMYHDSTNNLLLIYHLMISIASFLTIFLFYYQLKIKDISVINLSFSIAGNQIDLPFLDGLHLLIGAIYFLSFLFHFAITWKMCDDVCHPLDKPSGCYATVISSTLLSMLFPLIWSSDIVDNFLRNPNKRILYISIITFLSVFIYVFEFLTYDFGESEYYLNSYIRFAQTSFWLISAATAIIYVCEGFYHEGIMKFYFEIIVSFVLLCSPVVAFGANVIEFENGSVGVHETWFLLVTLSIFTAYDLQRLEQFNINVIGAQSTVRERLITAPMPDFGINTPSVIRKPPKYRAPVSKKGNINGIDEEEEEQKYQERVPVQREQLIYSNNDPDDDFEDNDEVDREDSFSYLVFKTFSFKLKDKKQRLLLFNTLLLIYSVGKFIYLFNFWVNYGKASFDALRNVKQNAANFAMHLSETSYQLYCISSAVMIVIAVSVIFMEWFVVSKQNEKGYKFYRYSCALLYVVVGVLQLVAAVNGTSDYCKHLNRVVDSNGANYYCHMQYVSTQLLSITLPLFVLSVDITGLTDLFYGNTRVRVDVIHFFVSLTALLFYVGYYNYYNSNDLSSYTTVKLMGFLMITFSFIFSAFLSPLFIYLQSKTFSNLANFIASSLVIIGTAVVLDVNDANVNVSEWTLFLPISCLVAYEIQLL